MQSLHRGPLIESRSFLFSSCIFFFLFYAILSSFLRFVHNYNTLEMLMCMMYQNTSILHNSLRHLGEGPLMYVPAHSCCEIKKATHCSFLLDVETWRENKIFQTHVYRNERAVLSWWSKCDGVLELSWFSSSSKITHSTNLTLGLQFQLLR